MSTTIGPKACTNNSVDFDNWWENNNGGNKVNSGSDSELKPIEGTPATGDRTAPKGINPKILGSDDLLKKFQLMDLIKG